MSWKHLSQLRDYLETLAQADDRQTSKTWTEGQIYFHLAGALEATMPQVALPKARLRRWCMTPVRLMLLNGIFPKGVPIPEVIRAQLQPPAVADAKTQRDRLLSAVDLLEKYDGPWPSHPIVGYLNGREWKIFHLRHCWHHLQYIKMGTTT